MSAGALRRLKRFSATISWQQSCRQHAAGEAEQVALPRNARLYEALNRLHAEIWASQGALELRGMINLTVPPQEGVQYPGALLLPDGGGAQALVSRSTSSPRTECQALGIHHERNVGLWDSARTGCGALST